MKFNYSSGLPALLPNACLYPEIFAQRERERETAKANLHCIKVDSLVSTIRMADVLHPIHMGRIRVEQFHSVCQSCVII